MGRYSGLAMFIGAFAAGILVTAVLRWPPAQSSDWAAWVQAVGSIGAIVAATKIASQQADRDRKLRRDELHERVQCVAVLVSQCRDVVLTLDEQIQRLPATNGLKWPHPDQVNAVRAAMNIVSLIRPEQAPTPNTVGALLRVQTAIAGCAGIVPMPSAEFHVGWGDKLKELARELVGASETLEIEAAVVANS
ncbi:MULTISPECIES: hypothetical protein [Burkholderia]|uniref:Uncharacterized protein n=1 Tax=Burkholderia glumae TaxID=337 RepID=A0AAP9Y2E0_BURGL|nr:MULTISPECIES: hypothetical protein [Burkholderia]ACR29185.1 Hypothetical protein bglu_1g20790 [Burkholderia glumae BGR1]MBU9422482.1 hypothetical protein [Burkholderia gladioli]MDN8060146.1 hypothetical protein [Burkholderia gladioli]PNL01258.1 hypothetical protein CEQ24_019770 [Burkholderia glumae]QPQ85092.1 hypothetical protein I6H08_08865 [Burkholderia gladioli]